VGQRLQRAVRPHGLDGSRIEEAQLARERGEGVGIDARHLREPGEIARPAVDRGPGLDLIQHRRGPGTFQHRPFGVPNPPHASALAGDSEERHTAQRG
jgi:hypothetical protein